jgi:signal transduction histidine kinase
MLGVIPGKIVSMAENTPAKAVLQDNSVFLEGKHDFQTDIEILTNSDLIQTVLETIIQATSMRFAAIARVTRDRWVACKTVDELNFGLASGDEIEIQSTFCQTVRDTGEQVIFSDVETDEIYQDHPIAAKFGIVSYVSIPINRSDGSFFGTLCAIDIEPRDVKNPRVLGMLHMFANIISQTLEAEEQLAVQDRLIEKERKLAEVQQEFVAILGHDLRNPVAALGAGLRQLTKEALTGKAQSILPHMRSSLRRVNELIDNMMMHAKSRLGDGIEIEPKSNAPLAERIGQVVEEVRLASPGTEISLNFSIGNPVFCDASRLAQAVSNLISNAINHGTPGKEIRVEGNRVNDELTISVTNYGKPIPEEVKREMFLPYQRGGKTKSEGLGLGLFIAHSITAAHQGKMEVVSENGTTSFSIRIPVADVSN